MEIKNKKLNKGVATIELLIAFAILVLNISAVILLINGGQSIYIDSETNTEAITKARAMLEQARADSEFDFALVNGYSTTEASGSLTYNKTLDVEQIDFFTKEVTSTISWLAEGGRTLNIILKTLLTNPDAVAGGDTCASELDEESWKNPQIITYKYEPSGDYICKNGEDEDGQNCEDGYELGKDILNDTSSGFPITSIQTFNHKMYVTVNNTKGNNDETFFILDISDKPELNSTHVLGKLDNSPEDEGDISEGLNAVAVDGENYAYVANAYDSAPAACVEADNCAQLQVIDISTPTSPSIERHFKIDSIATSGNLAYGTSIFYKNKFVYLGLAKSTGAELYKIDVSDPLDPDIIASAEVGNGVNSILASGGYVYVASPNADDLQVYNESNLNKVGFFNGPNGNANGKSLYKVGTKIYLGRTVSGDNEFYILNASNAPIIDSTPIGVKNITSSINGLLIRNFLAFFITATEFQIWDISNPSNIVEYASPLTLPPGSGNVQGSASDCEGNYIYVGSQKQAEESVPECSDGIDNDGDSKIDFPADNQCADADDSEKGGGNPQSQDKGYISIITGEDE